MNPQELAKKYLIFKYTSGSHLYGTATKDSDLDTRGCFIAPPKYYLSPFSNIEQCEDNKTDTVIYEIDKFVKLAAACNPNIIEALYVDDHFITFMDWPFSELRKNAHLFLSKKAKFTYSGYAVDQLQRIKGHEKWINNPQGIAPPKLSNYCTVINKDGSTSELSDAQWITLNENCFLARTKGQHCFRLFKKEGFAPGLISDDGKNFKFVDISEERLIERGAEYWGILLSNIDAFRQAHKTWNDYWNWKKNRNPERSKLEEKMGYDGKHASHLVRLMKTAKEILTEGRVIVTRPDAQELLAIRNGAMTYEELIKWAEEADQELNELYEKSTLQNSANIPAIEELLISIKQRYWREKGL